MNLCINPQCPQTENAERMLFCQSCGSEMLLAGKYRVAKLMSNKGGFGDTYEVTERGVPKVLKVLKSNDSKAIELFDREYQVLARLAGEGISGIPLVEDFFLYSPNASQTALHCIVMEEILGMDLEEYIKVINRPIDQKTAIGWLSQLTHILQEIHNLDIFHRDIKPSNIILQPDGQLVTIDFGAAKQAAIVTASGQRTRIYTPGYAAPEQERGEVSAQSDFFALGRTFVYLLTAKEPIDLHDSYRNLLLWRDKTTNFSSDFLDLIDRLMQEDPQQRPDSTATIFRKITALSPLVTHPSPVPAPLPSTINLPTLTPPSATSSQLTQPSRPKLNSSKKLLPILLGAAALLLLLSTLFMYLLGSKKSFSPGTASETTGASFADIQNVPEGTFKFGGSTTWATTRQLQSSIDAAIKGVHPKFDIVYTDAKSPNFKSVKNGRCDRKPGSNSGICWLLEGDLDFAQSSISLDKSTYKNDDRIITHQLKQEAVAYDAISVGVNPKLAITGLTIDQLRDIYTGTVTNWRQVGGPNLPIVTFARAESTGGTVSSFKDLVLKTNNKQQLQHDKWQPQPVGSTTEGLHKVSKNLGGIYYGAAKEIIIDSCNTKPLAIGKTADDLIKPYRVPLQSPAACRNGQRNQLNTAAIKSQTYPLTRQIYVISKTTDPALQKVGEAYTNLLKTQQGQNLLEKAGFVSIFN